MNENEEKLRDLWRFLGFCLHTQNPWRFPWFCFRNVSCSRRKLKHFGVSPLFNGKVTMFIGLETKTHILPTKINVFFAKVSFFNNYYSFLISNQWTSTTTIIQSGEAPWKQARSLHSTLGSWSMLSPKQAALPNPSYPALRRQDTTSPWSTDYGGNIFC